MADQSAAIGFSSSLISAVERGARVLPVDYLSRLAEWLELSGEDVAELRLLVTLGPITKVGREKLPEETLASILDRHEVDRFNPETVYENR
jgi:hypothetical protein